MKGSTLMFFQYLGMIGVPVLIIILAILSPLSGSAFGVVRDVVEILIGAGSIIYGAVSVRTIYIHGRRRE
ncbi:MAG: hypothetical protein JRN68_05150 [Nitrososphaerota archaeon]|nr:hypothetical protein [Nitrososphaerota archaeon]